jgi:hypothetical protein
MGPNGTARTTKPASVPGPHPGRLQARPQSRNGQSAADPLPVHPPRQMTHEKRVSRP